MALRTKPRISAEQFAQGHGSRWDEPSVDNTRVIMFGWPDLRIPVELAQWVFSRYGQAGHPEGNFGALNIQGIVQARNIAVRDYVLGAPERFRWFLFVDRDIRPNNQSDQIFKLDTDVRCCRVPTKNPNAWSRPDSFHDQFWLARREVFERTSSPWFMFPYTADGCALTGCLCSTFRRKILDAGFTISHGGNAGHDSDQSWH